MQAAPCGLGQPRPPPGQEGAAAGAARSAARHAVHAPSEHRRTLPPPHGLPCPCPWPAVSRSSSLSELPLRSMRSSLQQLTLPLPPPVQCNPAAVQQGPLVVYCAHLEVFCGMLARVCQLADIFEDSRRMIQRVSEPFRVPAALSI